MTQHPFFDPRNRQARREVFRQAVPAAMRKQGQSQGFDLHDKLNSKFNAPKALPEMIRAAVATTRDLLSTFDFPIPPDISYVGTSTLKTGTNQRYAAVEDGMISLRVAFITKSGVRNEAIVPVQIRDGAVLQPSVFLVNGGMQVISPSAVDQLLGAGTFYQPAQPRMQYGAPFTQDESAHWQRTQQQMPPLPRVNTGLFSVQSNKDLLRAAMQGDVAFRRQASQIQAQNIQPARGDMRISAMPATRIGNRVVTLVFWDTEQLAGMSEGNLMNAIRSHVLELGTKKEWRDWGTIADVQIDYMDRDAGEAEVSFKSSEISAPQLAGPDLKFAALAPGQEETDIDPAERPDRDLDLTAGDEVRLSKPFWARTRGGPQRELEKGTAGIVTKDVFGDGLMLEVRFKDDARLVVPSTHLKRAGRTASAKRAQSVEQVVEEIGQLRQAGYSPVDCILTARTRYPELSEAALQTARGKGLLRW